MMLEASRTVQLTHGRRLLSRCSTPEPELPMLKSDNESIELEQQHRVDGDEYDAPITMIVMMMVIASCVLLARWTTK